MNITSSVVISFQNFKSNLMGSFTHTVHKMSTFCVTFHARAFNQIILVVVGGTIGVTTGSYVIDIYAPLINYYVIDIYAP